MYTQISLTAVTTYTASCVRSA